MKRSVDRFREDLSEDRFETSQEDRMGDQMESLMEVLMRDHPLVDLLEDRP